MTWLVISPGSLPHNSSARRELRPALLMLLHVRRSCSTVANHRPNRTTHKPDRTRQQSKRTTNKPRSHTYDTAAIAAGIGFRVPLYGHEDERGARREINIAERFTFVAGGEFAARLWSEDVAEVVGGKSLVVDVFV